MKPILQLTILLLAAWPAAAQSTRPTEAGAAVRPSHDGKGDSGPQAPGRRTVSEMALRWQQPQGAPRHSDVSFSIRWMRKEVDPFEKIAAFHGTRFDWVYATKDFIAQCVQRCYPSCHCTAPCRSDGGPGEGRYHIGRAEGIRGQPLTASWQNWNPGWGCYSNPDFFGLMEQDPDGSAPAPGEKLRENLVCGWLEAAGRNCGLRIALFQFP